MAVLIDGMLEGGPWNSSELPRAHPSAQVGNIQPLLLVPGLVLYSCGVCCSLMPGYVSSQPACTQTFDLGPRRGGWRAVCINAHVGSCCLPMWLSDKAWHLTPDPCCPSQPGMLAGFSQVLSPGEVVAPSQHSRTNSEQMEGGSF